MWFNYKAQRTLKKMQIEATLRVSGCDIFRRERWLSSIRPVLVRVLGHEDSTKPEWVGTYKRVVAKLWNLLTEEERSEYERMAKEENEGHASRENKIACVLMVPSCVFTDADEPSQLCRQILQEEDKEIHHRNCQSLRSKAPRIYHTRLGHWKEEMGLSVGLSNVSIRIDN